MIEGSNTLENERCQQTALFIKGCGTMYAGCKNDPNLSRRNASSNKTPNQQIDDLGTRSSPGCVGHNDQNRVTASNQVFEVIRSNRRVDRNIYLDICQGEAAAFNRSK